LLSLLHLHDAERSQWHRALTSPLASMTCTQLGP
jgi:hypothetical protein